jgi:hypothetical protein
MMSTNKETRSNEPAEFDRTKLVLKHQMSGAFDAWTTFSIDAAAKTVEIEQRTPMGKPFLSASKLAELVLDWLPQQFDVNAFNNDDVDSWVPSRTEWTLFVRMGEIRLRAVVWKHHPTSSGDPRSTVELYPELEA